MRNPKCVSAVRSGVLHVPGQPDTFDVTPSIDRGLETDCLQEGIYQSLVAGSATALGRERDLNASLHLLVWSAASSPALGSQACGSEPAARVAASIALCMQLRSEVEMRTSSSVRHSIGHVESV